MSPSGQLTSEQQKEIIKDEKNTGKGARESQVQVEDGEEVLDWVNTSSVLNMVLRTINNEFEPECLDKAVRLLNASLLCLSTNDRFSGHKYSIPGLPSTKFLARQDWAIWLMLWRWVWDAEMAGALVLDEMGFGKTFTSVAVAMICKMVTEKVVMGVLLSILWGNTLQEWVILAHNDFPGIVGKEWEWYPLQRIYSLPCRRLEI